MKVTLIAATTVAAAIAPAAADTGDGPPWNITGDDWKCVKMCINNGIGQTTRVIQSGRQFRFINEGGSTASGEWHEGTMHVPFVNCDNIATVSADGKTISFWFGPVWAR